MIGEMTCGHVGYGKDLEFYSEWDEKSLEVFEIRNRMI